MYISRVVEKTRSGEHEFSRTENEELLRLQNENELLIAERDTLLKKYNNLNFVSKVFIALFLFSKIFRRNK
jgi:shikimate kinase